MTKTAIVGLCMLTVISVGCAKKTEALISGEILIDGAAPESGSIGFAPVDGKSKTTGGKIVDGRYSVSVPFGTVKVEIRSSKVVGQKKIYDTPDSPVQNVLAEVLPAKYNDETELQITVEEKGERTFDFPDLESIGKKKKR